jgi:hypothetical protein
MGSPPSSTNVMVPHVSHVFFAFDPSHSLSVVSSISRSKKFKKATNKGCDWSEDATIFLL